MFLREVRDMFTLAGEGFNEVCQIQKNAFGRVKSYYNLYDNSLSQGLTVKVIGYKIFESFVIKKIVQTSKTCPAIYLSDSTISCIDSITIHAIELLKLSMLPIERAHHIFVQAFSDNSYSHQLLEKKINGVIEVSVAGSIIEEILIRAVIQQGLLRHVPKKILNCVAPSYAWTIESNAAKVARVTFTASLFALMHTGYLPCQKGGAVPQFFGGLMYGAVTEATDSILASTKTHMVFNAVISLPKAIIEFLCEVY